MTVLADSGAIFALMDRDDSWHSRVREWVGRTGEDLLLPVTTTTEIAYMLHSRIGAHAESRFVRALASEEFRLEPLEAADLPRIAELLDAYADLPLGFVDASIVAMAERLDCSALLTTDRRDFEVVRPHHVARFRLLP